MYEKHKVRDVHHANELANEFVRRFPLGTTIYLRAAGYMLEMSDEPFSDQLTETLDPARPNA